MIAFVSAETIEWQWERLARVAALAGHCFACPSEIETFATRPPEHDAAPDMRRFEADAAPASEVVWLAPAKA